MKIFHLDIRESRIDSNKFINAWKKLYAIVNNIEWQCKNQKLSFTYWFKSYDLDNFRSDLKSSIFVFSFFFVNFISIPIIRPLNDFQLNNMKFIFKCHFVIFHSSYSIVEPYTRDAQVQFILSYRYWATPCTRTYVDHWYKCA